MPRERFVKRSCAVMITTTPKCHITALGFDSKHHMIGCLDIKESPLQFSFIFTTVLLIYFYFSALNWIFNKFKRNKSAHTLATQFLYFFFLLVVLCFCSYYYPFLLLLSNKVKKSSKIGLSNKNL